MPVEGKIFKKMSKGKHFIFKSFSLTENKFFCFREP